MKLLLSKIKSNRGDSNSLSQILWIVIAVAVITVFCYQGELFGFEHGLKSPLTTTANRTGARIVNSECYFKEGKPCTMKKGDGYTETDYRYERFYVNGEDKSSYRDDW